MSTLLKINNHSNLLFTGFRHRNKLKQLSIDKSLLSTVSDKRAANLQSNTSFSLLTKDVIVAAACGTSLQQTRTLLTAACGSLEKRESTTQPLNKCQSLISLIFTPPNSRSHYTFNLNNKLVKYRRSTRPKKTNDESVQLTYEQAQFAEHIGVTKTWNSWNTSNLLDGKRPAESLRDDIIIRKFIYGTFHELLSSEIIIKRRFNTIDIGFLIRMPNRSYLQKVYFLTGYSEELLSHLFKSIVKVQPQSIKNSNELVFRNW